MNINTNALKGVVDEIEASRLRQKAETEFQREALKRAVKNHQLDAKAVRIVLQRRAMGDEKRDSQDYYVHAYELALGGKKAALEALEQGATIRAAATVGGISTGAAGNLAKLVQKSSSVDKPNPGLPLSDQQRPVDAQGCEERSLSAVLDESNATPRGCVDGALLAAVPPASTSQAEALRTLPVAPAPEDCGVGTGTITSEESNGTDTALGPVVSRGMGSHAAEDDGRTGGEGRAREEPADHANDTVAPVSLGAVVSHSDGERVASPPPLDPLQTMSSDELWERAGSPPVVRERARA